MTSKIIPQIAAACALCCGGTAHAHNSAKPFRFDPLPEPAVVGSLPADAPFLLPAGVTQETVVSAQAVLEDGDPLTSIPLLGNDPASGSSRTMFDMIALNETGAFPGRYIFMAHETRPGGAYPLAYGGISRTDLWTGETAIISQQPDFQAIDPCLWTPFGTIITGEEATRGRLVELINPLEPDPEVVHTVHRTAIPRVAHEGLKFDAEGNLYFVDENGSGSIYKFVPANPDSPLAAGQSFVLRVASGFVGPATWVPITDENGAALPETAAALFDEGGIEALDGRAAADLVGGTGYNRPEDLEIGRGRGRRELLYVTTTGTDEVYAIELKSGTTANVTRFVSDATVDASTGLPVDSTANMFNSPDNLAIDAEGTIYIIEDSNPGDIWAARDVNGDGVAEVIARVASLATPGSEPTGMVFDPLHPNIAYVNVQHPNGGDDRLIRFVLGSKRDDDRHRR